MTIEKYKLLLGLLLCMPFFSKAQTLQDTLNKIDALFENVNQQTPGMSVLVSRNGQVIYHRHKGLANLELGSPITDSTRMEAGSVSKQFTATAILLLAQDGKIGLDDDVRKYIPELPKYGKTITVRHLIHHTSGVKEWYSIAGFGGWPIYSRIYTNELALRYIIKQPTLNNLPGDEHIYSNSNYALLAIIAERVSGRTLADFTRDRIFRPLGMNATGWRTDFRDIIPHRATGYEKVGSSYRMYMPFGNMYGAGALLTTVADLDKWNASWKDTPLGAAALLKLRMEQGRLNNGDLIVYAGGVRIRNHNERVMVHHGGLTAGYRAFLAYFPESDLSIAYLSNNRSLSSGDKIGDDIATIFFGKRTLPAVKEQKAKDGPPYILSREALAEFQGRYVSDACDGEFAVAPEDGTTLLFTAKSRQRRSFKPVSKDSFLQGTDTNVVFERNARGAITGFFISAPAARNVWFKRIGK